jgi:hypothetical protein
MTSRSSPAGRILRIGTWNLAGKWNERHHKLLLRHDVAVWLLTEIRENVQLDGYHRHLTAGFMVPDRHWAGVFTVHSLDVRPLPDPHPASAAAVVGGITYCSTLLPWRRDCNAPIWKGRDQGEKTSNAVADLRRILPLTKVVWGGDWNHTFLRPQVGHTRGEAAITAAVKKFALQVPTAGLPAQPREPGNFCYSIDHVAVPKGWKVSAVCRIIAVRELSDHDAYVVQVSSR